MWKTLKKWARDKALNKRIRRSICYGAGIIIIDIACAVVLVDNDKAQNWRCPHFFCFCHLWEKPHLLLHLFLANRSEHCSSTSSVKWGWPFKPRSCWLLPWCLLQFYIDDYVNNGGVDDNDDDENDSVLFRNVEATENRRTVSRRGYEVAANSFTGLLIVHPPLVLKKTPNTGNAQRNKRRSIKCSSSNGSADNVKRYWKDKRMEEDEREGAEKGGGCKMGWGRRGTCHRIKNDTTVWNVRTTIRSRRWLGWKKRKENKLTVVGRAESYGRRRSRCWCACRRCCRPKRRCYSERASLPLDLN